MLFFRRKHEFKPDRTEPGALKKLYLTRLQRLHLLKWSLMGLMLLMLSLLQDAVLSRISIYGATFDLVACGILLGCMFFQPDTAAVFALISSIVYYFSGTAPGVFSIALLTALGVLICIFRRSYLRWCFSTTFICAGIGLVIYKMAIFVIGLFLSNTTFDRIGAFAISGLLSAAVIPALYPILTAISNIGGEAWKE